MDFLDNNENNKTPLFETRRKHNGSQVNSLNDLVLADNQSSRDCEASNEDSSNYLYERRMGRQVSIYVHPSRDSKFYKLIIPYNFEKKMYYIKEKEIEFYEHKQYLLDKLQVFNSNTVFDIEKTYKAKGFKKLKLYLPTIFILSILIYISILVLLMFFLNPMVIYTLYSWNRKAFNSLRMYRFILLEKYKMKEIMLNIENENKSNECEEKKIKWIVGQSGYWLEVQKLVD